MKFRFSGLMLRFTDYQAELEVTGSCISTGLDSLHRDFPRLGGVLLDATGKLRSSHRLFLNGEMVRSDSFAQPVAPSDTIDVLTALAGG